MTIKIKSISTFLILAVLSTACNRLTPADFWTKFQNPFLVENISGQGPWGGHRAMYWKIDKRNTFRSKTVLDFASKNGWQLIDSSAYSSDDLENWKLSNKLIFPLSSNGFDKISKNDINYNNFPRWINSDLKMYKFKTGWIVIDPDTNNSIEENGFVIINDKGTEMSVYHLWGD